MKIAVLALVLSAGSAVPAFAGFCDVLPMFCDDDGSRPAPAAISGSRQPHVQPAVTPEIDPGMLAGTFAILAGGMLILAGKRRRC